MWHMWHIFVYNYILFPVVNRQLQHPSQAVRDSRDILQNPGLFFFSLLWRALLPHMVVYCSEQFVTWRAFLFHMALYCSEQFVTWRALLPHVVEQSVVLLAVRDSGVLLQTPTICCYTATILQLYGSLLPWCRSLLPWCRSLLPWCRSLCPDVGLFCACTLYPMPWTTPCTLNP